MPLSQIALQTALNYTLSKTNSGFNPTVYGPDSASFSLTGISAATWNEISSGYYSLAASANVNIDLTAQTNLVGESFSFGHVLGIMVLPTGADVTLAPGDTSPLQWFFGGTTQSAKVKAGGCLVLSDPASGSGYAVTNSNHNLKVTNVGSGTALVKVFVIGSTT